MTKQKSIKISDYFTKTVDNLVTQYFTCERCPPSKDNRWSVRKQTGRPKDDTVRRAPDMKRLRDHAKVHRRKLNK